MSHKAKRDRRRAELALELELKARAFEGPENHTRLELEEQQQEELLNAVTKLVNAEPPAPVVDVNALEIWSTARTWALLRSIKDAADIELMEANVNLYHRWGPKTPEGNWRRAKLKAVELKSHDRAHNSSKPTWEAQVEVEFQSIQGTNTHTYFIWNDELGYQSLVIVDKHKRQPHIVELSFTNTTTPKPPVVQTTTAQ